MTIGKKIMGGYLAVLALFAIVCVLAFAALLRIQTAYTGFLDVDAKLMEDAAQLRAELQGQVADYRAVLLYPDAREFYLGQMQDSRRRFDETVSAMQRRVRYADGRRLLEEIAALQARSRAAQDRIAGAASGSRQGSRQEVEALRLLNESLLDRAAAFQDYEARLLSEGRAEAEDGSDRIIWIAALVSAAGFLVSLSMGLYLSRGITAQLQNSIALLSSSAAEILATTTQVASGAAETATAVSETTATVDEVKQTAQLASQKARSVSESAQRAAQVSAGGRKSVDDSIAGMRRIQEQMQSIAESIVRLSEQGQAIGEIIATVNDLAEQSNLLAVNAAIEASRAGEHGKGFAVVAQEVRSLATQSKQATAQVRTILGDIQKATSAAVLATEQGSKAVDAGVVQSTVAGDSIRSLAESIDEAAQAAVQIAASSQQQRVGMDQVGLAMESIKQASMQNVSGTKQAEVAAHGLHELGQKLGELIGRRAA